MRPPALLALLLAAGLVPGCAAPRGAASFEVVAPPVAPAWRSAGTSREGRGLDYAVFGEGPSTVLLVAGIHGNEEAGTPLLEELAARLAGGGPEREWLAGRRVVVLPALNPDGLDAGRRHNAAGVDLNRNFPARNFGGAGRGGEEPLSEPESRALRELVLAYGPDRVLTFHMPVGVIDYDGPARALAEALSQACGLPVRRLGGRPGSLGSWLGVDRGVPTVTVELPASDHGAGRAELWTRYAALLEAALTHAVE